MTNTERTTIPVSISLTPSLLNEVKKEVAETSDSVSHLMRAALSDYLRKRKRLRQKPVSEQAA